MTAKRFVICLASLAISTGGTGYFLLKKDNIQLRQAIEKVRLERKRIQLQSEATAPGRNGETQPEITPLPASRELDQQVAAVRQEAASLERRAEEQRLNNLTKDREGALALATNHDPTKGLILIENCANVGRASPAQAFQTFVWAAVKGDDDAMAASLLLDAEARNVAAALGEKARALTKANTFSTPEKTAGLLVSDAILNVAALQITKESADDATHVKLFITANSGDTAMLPMQLGANGWQVAVSEPMLQKQIRTSLKRP